MEGHSCTNHSDRAAVEMCPHCLRPFCEFCMGFTGSTSVCTSCAATLKRRQEQKRATVLGGLGLAALVGVGAVAAFIGLRNRAGAAGTGEATPDPPKVVALKKQLAAAPCDKALAAALGDQLDQAQRFHEALSMGAAWHKRCGPDGTLDWKLLYAAKELGQYHKALKLADGIVAGDPGDSDFWWWRGEIRDRLGQNGATLADYRQSIANSEGDQASAAVARIVDPARAAHEPCEAADAIRYFVDDLDGQIAADLRDDMVSLTRQGDCLAKASGTARFAIGDDLHPAVVRAKVGGRPGRFYVDDTTGTTAISKAFARRAGIKVGTGRAQTVVAGQAREGRLGTTTVAIGHAHAEDVDVLVADDLGAKVDGVIGLDFLWRFDQASGDGHMAIFARK